MRLFHLIDPREWEAAREAGAYEPASLADEGFVHFSFASQVAGTANLRYRGATELIVLEVDPALVGAELRVEDSYGSGTEFPHVYGAIPPAAVVNVHPMKRNDGGNWTFTPDA